MSSSETDSEVSCPSDDSNYNFIPQYMIEDAEFQVENRHELPASDDEGPSSLAYADEPLADEAWLENYNREERERLEEEEKFNKRLNSSVEIGEWYIDLCLICGLKIKL